MSVDAVYAFQPRRYDPPQYVAEDADYLDSLAGGFIPGGQCDGCGNASYRVETARGRYWAVCAVDPSDDPEFRHPDPCGSRYPITLRPSSEVAF